MFRFLRETDSNKKCFIQEFKEGVGVQLEFAYFCNVFTAKSISDLKGEGQGQDYFCITFAIMTLDY